MKLLPVLLGVALLVLIMETGETEGGPEKTPEDFFEAAEKKDPSLWEKIKGLGQKFKKKARNYLHKLLTKVEESAS